MKHVSERLGMHEAMLDGHLQQETRFRRRLIQVRLGRSRLQSPIERLAHAGHVLAKLGETGPILRLIGGQATANRVDSKRKEAVEFGMERRNVKRASAKQAG